MKVAVLISVSGRIEEAMECLSGVYRQSDSLAGEGKYTIDIFLDDDTGGDGLSEMVAARFPDVRIVRSPERLSACRGLRQAWLEASGEDYDFYLWLDPALSLTEGAFGILLENSNFLRHEAIIAGSVSLADGSHVLMLENEAQLMDMPKQKPWQPKDLSWMETLRPDQIPTQEQMDEWLRPNWCLLDFEKLATSYDAIELANAGAFQHSLNSWDCNCILVMNPDIVKVI